MGDNPRLKFLTYNAGLFRVRLFGKKVFEAAPYVDERFAELAPALLSFGADIIALQEVFDDGHQRLLSASLSEAYPFQGSWTERKRGCFHSGLMLFSKYPILDSSGRRFSFVPWDERLFVEKGILTATVDAGPFGMIAIANCHHTSGGAIRSPEGEFTDEARRRQYRELFAALDASPAEKRIALGDFNSGPEATGKSYRELVSGGYADAWAICHGQKSAPTWHPDNLLNVRGPHRKYAAQRLDHILANDSFLRAAPPVDARIVFDEPMVAVPDGHVSISDHYGLSAEFELAPTDLTSQKSAYDPSSGKEAS
jgi:endonuclease/exonuclease/phosphatase family metal-dependent hydrolase